MQKIRGRKNPPSAPQGMGGIRGAVLASGKRPPHDRADRRDLVPPGRRVPAASAAEVFRRKPTRRGGIKGANVACLGAKNQGQKKSPGKPGEGSLLLGFGCGDFIQEIGNFLLGVRLLLAGGKHPAKFIQCGLFSEPDFLVGCHSVRPPLFDGSIIQEFGGSVNENTPGNQLCAVQSAIPCGPVFVHMHRVRLCRHRLQDRDREMLLAALHEKLRRVFAHNMEISLETV